MSFLIDTNVLSELVKNKPNKSVIQWFEEVPDDTLFISVLTVGEIRKGIEKLQDEKRKIRLKTWLEHDLAQWFDQRILSIDQVIAERWGKLCASAGRPLPVIDSLLVAQALHFDMAVVTRNEFDFDVSGLEVVNPWV